MSVLNSVIQHIAKVFNYKTYIKGKGYMTANLLTVAEYYRNLYKSYSEVDKLEMWQDILTKWYISYLRHKLAQSKKINFKKWICPEPWTESYESWRKKFNYTLTHQIHYWYKKYGYFRPDVAYLFIGFILDDYKHFTDFVKSQYGEMNRKIKYSYAIPAKAQDWVESKEVIPGHYSDITKYNPKSSSRYYRLHFGDFDITE